MPNEEILVANAVAVWKSAVERADKMFTGLTDDDLLREVAPGRNRLIYLLGHLTAIHDKTIVLLGLGERVSPEFDAIFLTAADKTVELPSTAVIRESWKTVNERLNKGIAATTASQWLERHTAVSEEDFAKEPLRNRFSILLSRTSHLAYHLGQATLAKR